MGEGRQVAYFQHIIVGHGQGNNSHYKGENGRRTKKEHTKRKLKPSRADTRFKV